jgi:ATP/maltotriose-dependent transcriptional regulator MalT
VELLAGRPDLAEAELRPDFDTLQAIGERYALSSTAALLGISVYLQDRLDEALELARVSEEATAEDDIESQALFRRLRARVLARRGEVDAGERLAREAVALAGGTDAPILQAHSLMDLAEVLIEGNDPNRAVELVRGARERFDRKGDVVSAGRARGTLERLGAGAGAAVPPGRP